MKLVIPELVMDRVPDSVRRGLGSADDGANVLGDGVIEPADDALVDHGPLAITAVGSGRRRGETRADAKFADECIEKAPPLGVIRLGDVKLDGDVGLDVDGLQHGGRERRGGSSVGFGIEGGGRGLDVRYVGVEKRVGVHSSRSRRGEEATDQSGRLRRAPAGMMQRADHGEERGVRGGAGRAERRGAAVARKQGFNQRKLIPCRRV